MTSEIQRHLQEQEFSNIADSKELFKSLVSIGTDYQIMGESVRYEQNRPMPQAQQYQYPQPQQYVPSQPTYDPMSEFDMTPSVPSGPQYIVEQVGSGANTKYNVSDSRTGQVYASCMMPEAAQKISKLMNEGKMFTDIEVMKCVMSDAKFTQKINEMRVIKTNIEQSSNQSEKSTLISKLNIMKEEAINLKKAL